MVAMRFETGSSFTSMIIHKSKSKQEVEFCYGVTKLVYVHTSRGLRYFI